MPQLVDLRTNKPVEVSDDETAALLRSGNFSFTGPLATMISPSGETIGVKTDDPGIYKNLQNGFRFESAQEERKRYLETEYGSSDIKAFLAGAARGATFGLSDVLLTKAGGVDDATLKDIAEANPWSSQFGEAAAIGASLLVPGGAPLAAAREAGLLGKAGAVSKGAAKFMTAPVRAAERISEAAGGAVERTLLDLLGNARGGGSLEQMLTKSAKWGTQGVVDGALFGAGQLVSESALGDTDLNAERIISHVGASALLSGAAAGALGGLIGLGTPAAKKAYSHLVEALPDIPNINREWAANATKEWSQEAALSSVGGLSKLWRTLKQKKLIERGPEAMFETLAPDGKPVMLAGLDADQLSERLTATTNEIGARIGNVIDGMDNAGIGTGVTANELADRFQKNIQRPSSKSPYTQDVVKKLDDVIGWLRDRGDQEMSHRWVQDRRNELRGAYNKLTDPGNVIESFQAQERELNNVIEESLQRNLSPEEFTNFKNAKDTYHSLADIEKITADRVNTLQANRFFSLGDRINSAAIGAGAISGGLLGDTPSEELVYGTGLGMMAAAGSRMWRTRGASVLAVFLNKASKMLATESHLQKAATNHKVILDDMLAEIIGKPAKSSPAKESKIGVIFDATMPDTATAYDPDSAIALAGGTNYRKVSKSAEYETIDKKGGEIVANEANTALAMDQAQRVIAMASDPNFAQKINDNVDRQMGDIAPEITQAMSSRLITMISFLASKAPTNTNPSTLTPKADKPWKPSQQQAAAYLRYAEAVHHPMQAVKDLRHGIVNNEALEVLKTLYPSMHKDVSRYVIEQLGNSEKPIPYNKRILLSSLFNVGTSEPTLSPKFFSSLHPTSPQQGQPQAAPQGRGTTQNAIKTMEKDAKSSQTLTQRISGET